MKQCVGLAQFLVMGALTFLPGRVDVTWGAQPDIPASSAQSAYTWGPYTAGGSVVPSPRENERFTVPVSNMAIHPHTEVMWISETGGPEAMPDQGRGSYFVLMPGASVVYGNPRHNYLYADYSAGFDTLGGGGLGPLSSQTLTLAGHCQNGKSRTVVTHRFQEMDSLDPYVGVYLNRTDNSTMASYENSVSRKTSVGLRVNHELHEYNTGDYVNYRDFSLEGELGWWVQPRSELSLIAAHGWVQNDKGGDSYGSAQYDEVMAGLVSHLRSRLDVSGRVGLQHRYYEDEGLDDLYGYTGNLRAEVRPFDTFRVWLGASSGIRPAVSDAGYTMMDTRFEPGVSRRLWSERLVGSLNGVWGWVDYSGRPKPDAADAAEVQAGRRDQYVGLTGSLDWWVGRFWSVGVSYSYLKHDSSSGSADAVASATDRSSYDTGRWMIRVAFNQ